MNVGKLVSGIIVIVLGALMLAEGILVYVSDSSIFFEGTNPSFAAAVGLVVMMVGGSLVEEGRRE